MAIPCSSIAILARACFASAQSSDEKSKVSEVQAVPSVAPAGAPMRDFMGELLYHYENPKFAGLPWPADRYKTSRRCVKLNYSLADAQEEAAKLRDEAASFRWSFKFCASCQGFHVCREKTQ